MCSYGPSEYGKPESWTGHDLMAICNEYLEGMRSYLRRVNNDEVRFLLVDKELFESDLSKGALGDFLTDKILYPHRPEINAEYFDRLDKHVCKRIIREEVRNLIFEYGEMSRGLVAQPEFYALARMRLRARIFVPSMYEYLKLLDPAVRDKNLSMLRSSFMEAATSLRGETVELDDRNNIIIPDAVVDRYIQNKSSGQVVNILRQSQRAFYSYLTKGRSVYLSPDLLARELYDPLRLQFDRNLTNREPEDPKKHLFIRTASGLNPITERFSLEEIISKLRRGSMTIIPLAGVLNEVFLISTGKEKFVAKKFTDWHSFKWFTLNLVSIGTKLFSVSGKARMTNEYGINRYLAKRKLSVPEIIHVNLNDRILLEDYVPGTSLDHPINEIVNQNALSDSQVHLAELFGETLAMIHQVGVSMGDSKPENFITRNEMIYAVDLEQAGKKGDHAWDIAEAIYYSGHYSRVARPTRGVISLVEAFIRGYTKHGEKQELRKAGGVKYMKVFSIWTPAPILLELSNILRET